MSGDYSTHTLLSCLFLLYHSKLAGKWVKTCQGVGKNLPKCKCQPFAIFFTLKKTWAGKAFSILHFFEVQKEFQPTISNLPCSEVMWSNWTNSKTGNYSKEWVSWVRLFTTQNKGLDTRTTAYRGIISSIRFGCHCLGNPASGTG